jgi:GT2 family glycosyltransferase
MISIVTAYHNRRDLFINTLESLEKSEISDYEIIAVDDTSSDEHRIEDLVEKYPKLKVIRINPEDKWWVNPCVTFNVGFKAAAGDIIVLQNPECKHNGDVLKKASEIKDGQYYSFACYSLDKESTYSNEQPIIHNRPASMDGQLSWYNHSVYRPKGYHFCAAITKNNLEKLGGFDEQYAMGIAYDDDEFFYRVSKLGLQISIIDYPYVMHQWHQSVNYTHLDAAKLIERNRNLFINYTQRKF